jgi:translation initiation factor 2 subunit 2
MEEKDYLKLLDKAYSELPEVLYKKERFEIPKVTGRIIKTRTLITNFGEIAKYFSRDKDHMYKFLLKDLGIRGEYNEKGELTLHSKFQPNVLNKAVENYFKNYVQCTHCHSPDTIFINNGATLKCNACGHQETIQKL